MPDGQVKIPLPTQDLPLFPPQRAEGGWARVMRDRGGNRSDHTRTDAPLGSGGEGRAAQVIPRVTVTIAPLHY